MVDDAVNLIRSAGHGALMAKLDLKAAYRHVPVHPDDQSLLAIRATYLDTALLYCQSAEPQHYMNSNFRLFGSSLIYERNTTHNECKKRKKLLSKSALIDVNAEDIVDNIQSFEILR